MKPLSRRQVDSLGERLLSVPEVASFLNVHRSTIYKLMGRPGGIPFVEIGTAVRFRPSDVRAYVEGHVTHDAGGSRVEQLLSPRR